MVVQDAGGAAGGGEGPSRDPKATLAMEVAEKSSTVIGRSHLAYTVSYCITHLAYTLSYYTPGLHTVITQMGFYSASF